MTEREVPGYFGGEVWLDYTLDNLHAGDRYLAVFTDGTALCVRHDGARSAWQDDLYDRDPWTLGRKVHWAALPEPIRREVTRRASELDQLLSEDG